jgi:parvulin-like peptidyl-prolyl isomerase
MSKRFFLLLAAAPLAVACGSSIPEPKQPMADAVAATRSAREVGADSQPAAKLHVKLADEQIAKAQKEIADGENQRATYLLLRARADAELALALAREQNAVAEKQKAVEQSNTTRTNDNKVSKP